MSKSFGMLIIGSLPCVKGGGSRERDGGIVNVSFSVKTIPHRPRRSSLYTREPFFMFIYDLSIFLTSTDLIKDTKAIIFVNSQALLTNRVKCGIMFTLHKLHIFSLIRENTLVKSVFSLFSYRIGESLCSNIRGGAFFRCIPSGVHLFICG